MIAGGNHTVLIPAGLEHSLHPVHTKREQGGGTAAVTVHTRAARLEFVARFNAQKRARAIEEP